MGKKILKFILVLGLVVFLTILGLFVYFNFQIYSQDKNYYDDPVVSLVKENGETKIKISETNKEELKIFLRKIKKIIYHEATLHNPEGDMLPDNIDDDIIKKIKDKVE
ncbi:MAG: hypothetical protein COU40_02770 [Candidatus Moranbacteria bacterium CG10_big_fil_rev_8_21_14_0_10_35_21]|nr:MAG: hypothetical protein COU40_02770 [Candidatus Moranbacteria bacterium CG10_big_fil_rev_8_21_14_0_10_35_21]